MLISRFVKPFSLAITEVALLTLGIFYSSGEAHAATFTQTLPEYSFDGAPTFPNPSNIVGTFSFSLPSDEKITAAVLEGTFGNSEFPSSAGVDLYLDNLLVAQCIEFEQCWSGPGPVTWRFTFDESHFSQLEDGMAVLSAAQTSEFITRLGETTLTIETTPQPSTSVPEPATVLGLLAIGGSLLLSRKPSRSGPGD